MLFAVEAEGPSPALLVGGIAEAVVPGLTTTEIVKSVGVVMGKMALGAVGFAGFLALAYIS